MFIVTDKRFREIARTAHAGEAMGLKKYFNETAAYAPLAPFGVSYLPERMLPEVLNVVPFPKRR
jgi:hypothetical protein